MGNYTENRGDDFMTLVSIIIPSLNQGCFIDDAIQSVIQQTHRPIEVLVRDGGSTDDTLAILEKYTGHPSVSWVSEKDDGQADAINKGFGCARGEIVAWLNSDDAYFARDVFEQVVQMFSEQPEVDILYGDVAIISDANNLLRLFMLPAHDAQRIRRKNLISQPGVFFRRKVISDEKLKLGQIGLDYEYWLRLEARGYRFRHIREILACDRHYAARLSVTQWKLLRTQITRVKAQYGISPAWTRVMYPADRLAQAVCRLAGFIKIFTMMQEYDEFKDRLAIPLTIDSFPRLMLRQIMRPIRAL